MTSSLIYLIFKFTEREDGVGQDPARLYVTLNCVLADSTDAWGVPAARGRIFHALSRDLPPTSAWPYYLRRLSEGE